MGLGIGFFLVVVVPLTAMLLHHQRKMAEFLNRGALQQDKQTQLDRLESEVAMLKDRINHLILQVEGARPEAIAPPAAPPLPDQSRSKL